MEDDYDCEFRMSGVPVPQLVGALKASAAGPRLTFEEADSGLHFVLAADVAGDAAAEERRIAQEALKRGVRLAPLGGYARGRADATRADGRARFVMQYDGLDPECVGRVADAISRACLTPLA